MSAIEELQTERLALRRWSPADDEAMLAINSDPEVTRYLNRPVDAVATAAFGRRAVEHWEEHGFGLYSVRVVEGDDAMLGFVGLGYPTFLPALAHRCELGWRLSRAAWGHGYATEAAIAVRDVARGPLALADLISIIHPQNQRSTRVAGKLGMRLEHHVFNPVLSIDVDVWSFPGEGDRTIAFN